MKWKEVYFFNLKKLLVDKNNIKKKRGEKFYLFFSKNISFYTQTLKSVKAYIVLLYIEKRKKSNKKKGGDC